MSENFEKKIVEDNCTVFLEELQAARNFSKVSLHFFKIPEIYPETCIFCVLQKIVFWKQSAKIALKVPGKSCDEIHIIVNLGQKYEGDLGIYY